MNTTTPQTARQINTPQMGEIIPIRMVKFMPPAAETRRQLEMCGSPKPASCNLDPATNSLTAQVMGLRLATQRDALELYAELGQALARSDWEQGQALAYELSHLCKCAQVEGRADAEGVVRNS